MKDNSFSRLISRYWPLVIFSLPGVAAIAIGLIIGYNYAKIQLANPDLVWEGNAGMTVALIVGGMVAFFAGLILGALNDVRLKLDDQLRALQARRPAAAGMAFEGERFVEPARPAREVERG